MLVNMSLLFNAVKASDLILRRKITQKFSYMQEKTKKSCIGRASGARRYRITRPRVEGGRRRPKPPMAEYKTKKVAANMQQK